MTNKPNIEALNREFAELTGMKWHEMEFRAGAIVAICSCGKEFRWLPFAYEHERTANTDYAAEPWKVLKVMRGREDWNGTFIYHIGGEVHCGSNYNIPQELIPIHLILDTTGLLLKEAVEWLRKEAKP